MLFYSSAKINLFLNVLDKRIDGYHNLQSLFLQVALFDELYFYFSDKPFSINLLDNSFNLDKDFIDNNIITKTYNLIRKNYSYFFKGQSSLRLFLKKNIPLAAGLGGGSSNSAVTIFALMKLYGFLIPCDELFDIASEIGSDVPFFIKGGIARVEGIGDRVFCYNDVDCDFYLIIVYPGIKISTADSYKLLDLFGCDFVSKKNQCNLIIEKIKSKNLFSMSKFLYNSFENLQFSRYPVLQKIKKKLIDLGAVNCLLSGSGSSLFGIFSSKTKLDIAYNFLKKENKYKIFSTFPTIHSYFKNIF